MEFLSPIQFYYFSTGRFFQGPPFLNYSGLGLSFSEDPETEFLWVWSGLGSALYHNALAALLAPFGVLRVGTSRANLGLLVIAVLAPRPRSRRC